MFTKAFVAPNGANTMFHSVKRIEAANPGDFITAHVQSFLTQDDAMSGSAVPSWSQPIPVPKTAIQGAFDADIEHWLCTGVAGPFLGASVVAVTDTDLAAARIRQWARVKGSRNAAIMSGFEVEGSGRFDSDLQSQVFIIGACVEVAGALAAGAPPETPADTWTLADNTTAELTLGGVMGLGTALGAHIRTCLAAGRALRSSIDAAATVEEVEAVVWTG